MKRTAESSFLATAVAGFFFVGVASASFEPLPVGGRAAGMGEAYTAIVDDVYSLYYNPAGILQLQRPELGAYYSQLFVGLTDNSEISRSFFGYGQPFGKSGRLGGIGVSYLALDLPGLYKEEAIGLTYGREFRQLWNLGVSVKYLRKSIGTDEFSNNAINPANGQSLGGPDPLLASGRSANGFGLDLGAQYRFSRAYALGFAVKNLNAPDLGLGGEKDRAPAIFSTAIARRLRRGSLGVEMTNWKGANKNVRFALGGEHWFSNGIGLRAGGGFGSRDFATVTFGASYKMESLQFDYATVYPLQGVEDTLGIQQIALTVRLGKPPMDPLEAQLIKEKEQRIRAETEARYAKAERDRLKKQLLELTEGKTEREREDENQSAAEALRDAQEQANQAAETRRQEAVDLFNAYTRALANYNEQVRRGIDLSEKKRLLDQIRREFDGKGVNMATVEREMRSLDVAQNRAKQDFDLSMRFYSRLVEQGASEEERRSMLERIVQKYRGTGIDIAGATTELETLSE